MEPLCCPFVSLSFFVDDISSDEHLSASFMYDPSRSFSGFMIFYFCELQQSESENFINIFQINLPIFYV